MMEIKKQLIVVWQKRVQWVIKNATSFQMCWDNSLVILHALLYPTP